MKQRDIIVIAIVAITSGIFSLILANLMFGGEKAYKLTAPTIDPITADFKVPNGSYYTKQSLNLTKIIIIGDNGNPTPFNKTQP
ncbi:MAG: hypothetical protein WCP03_03105 [Candidatus Saccharibacteria bacterium]